MESVNPLHEYIDSLENHPIRTALIEVFEDNREVGEDFDESVRLIAESVLQIDGVKVYRISWRYLVVFSTHNECLTSRLPTILKKAAEHGVSNRAIIIPTIGPSENRLSQVSAMELQLAKLNCWSIHLFSGYYLNGRFKALHT